MKFIFICIFVVNKKHNNLVLNQHELFVGKRWIGRVSNGIGIQKRMKGLKNNFDGILEGGFCQIRSNFVLNPSTVSNGHACLQTVRWS